MKTIQLFLFSCMLLSGCRILRKYIQNADQQAEKIRNGNQYLGNMNAKWLDIIGARVKDVTITYDEHCVCTRLIGGEVVTRYMDELSEKECDEYTDVIHDWNCEYLVAPTTTITTRYLPNDAVVTNESSFQFPGVNRITPMIESNHAQMRNDSNTQDVLNNLFDGLLVKYFETATRN